MYPTIFSYKILTIGGYGILLALAFYLGFLLSEREFKLSNKDPELAYKLLLFVIPSAIIGAKIFHILDHFDSFLNNPLGLIFSGSGLSVLGGFVLSFIASIIIIKKNNESILEIFDLASPTMALGYAIGRIGCHVAGDNCYGIDTTSIIGVAFPNGLSPTSAEVIPTPLFESFFSFLVLILLLQLRKREHTGGTVFFIYLILMGIPRFFIEFIRLNPKLVFNLTQAQVVSILFVITGMIGLIVVNKKRGLTD